MQLPADDPVGRYVAQKSFPHESVESRAQLQAMAERLAELGVRKHTRRGEEVV